jgi:hypothetical protein
MLRGQAGGITVYPYVPYPDGLDGHACVRKGGAKDLSAAISRGPVYVLHGTTSKLV